MKKYFLPVLFVFTIYSSSFAQRAISEKVNYFDIRKPNNPLDKTIKSYKVIVETPYTLTAEEVNVKSLQEFEVEKENYDNLLETSKAEFEKRLASYDDDVKKQEERYDKLMKDFKALSLIERLALTQQGKEPKLKVPSKPRYVEPREPIYRKPNLDDNLIFDNNVLADGINLFGYEKGEDILFIINISKMVFQDNGGQTYYNQPTSLKVIYGADIIDEKKFDDKFKFLTSTSSNSINLDRHEKNNVKKNIRNIENYMNEEFGFTPVSSSIYIQYPKNKKREYDVLENAKIKVISAYRKLKKDASLETRERVKEELEAVRLIWKTELSKVDYKNKKALMNKEIAKIILFNLMRVDISIKDKKQAEETLALMQEKRIDLDLNYTEKATFTRLEEQVYKL
ncbi:hypothetical protein [Polaribacter sp. Hel1_85]|uniref:hypothetical protein n=1 Tax=Polaribacter sp. Hel1_85 TaxID=1250005 RepID=UPI00052D43F3|nr:hypothetical protein [Polaribacter sp. Hel1_85]KGL64088.1 hypothetical protein PHEL85_1133 [Polaribacter sp. Hel1_85]